MIDRLHQLSDKEREERRRKGLERVLKTAEKLLHDEKFLWAIEAWLNCLKFDPNLEDLHRAIDETIRYLPKHEQIEPFLRYGDFAFQELSESRRAFRIFNHVLELDSSNPIAIERLDQIGQELELEEREFAETRQEPEYGAEPSYAEGGEYAHESIEEYPPDLEESDVYLLDFPGQERPDEPHEEYPDEYADEMPATPASTAQYGGQEYAQTGPAPDYDEGSEPAYDEGREPAYDEGSEPAYDEGREPAYDEGREPAYPHYPEEEAAHYPEETPAVPYQPEYMEPVGAPEQFGEEQEQWAETAPSEPAEEVPYDAQPVTPALHEDYTPSDTLEVADVARAVEEEYKGSEPTSAPMDREEVDDIIEKYEEEVAQIAEEEKVGVSAKQKSPFDSELDMAFSDLFGDAYSELYIEPLPWEKKKKTVSMELTPDQILLKDLSPSLEEEINHLFDDFMNN